MKLATRILRLGVEPSFCAAVEETFEQSNRVYYQDAS